MNWKILTLLSILSFLLLGIRLMGIFNIPWVIIILPAFIAIGSIISKIFAWIFLGIVFLVILIVFRLI